MAKLTVEHDKKTLFSKEVDSKVPEKGDFIKYEGTLYQVTESLTLYDSYGVEIVLVVSPYQLLNLILSGRDLELVNKMKEEKGLSDSSLIVHSLRTYQTIHELTKDEAKQIEFRKFLGLDEAYGCGWPGMD